ncbi:MAG TPA: class I SAM-dependent rRNA methyltransferase [Candidatus Aquilonibacter sp.]
MKELWLAPKADKRVRLGHNWIFSNEVAADHTALASFAPGELARVVDAGRNPVGIAYVNPAALICARILTRDVRATIDVAWFAARIRRALAMREALYAAPFYRLLYGESDGVPGIVVDRYGDVCVVQLNTAGAMAQRETFIAALTQTIAPKGIVLRNAGSTRALEGIEPLDQTLGEVPERVVVIENDMRIAAPLRTGQKTGYFYDQRDNRLRLRRYVKPGDDVLDVFSYVGGWAVSALQAGAHRVTCIDQSELALGYADENARAIGKEIDGLAGDALEVMHGLAAEKRRYDVVVLDPPALVKRRKDAAAGERHYLRLHEAALRLLRDDGFAITASCSYHLAPERLQRIALDAARGVGRRLQILERHGQAPDHPVHPAMPETEYLKALFTRA